MPTFPIPIFVAVLLAFLAIYLLMRQNRAGWLAVLCAVCAVQALIISLVQHYGLGALRPLQPVTAALVPGLAWLAFKATAVRPVTLRRDWPHMAGPALVLAALVLAPVGLDGLVPMLFAGYGLALLLAVFRTDDGLPQARLDTGKVPGRIWAAVGATLIGSALSDLAIIGAHGAGLPGWQPWIVSIATTGTLVVLGWLVLSPGLFTTEGATPEAAFYDDAAAEQDAQIMARLDVLLDETRLYLDPELTLLRLSRRMGLPVKTLSAAINRTTSENVSRLINKRRINHACERLGAGDNVTAAWLSSGFNTKSNFNREFVRVTGKPPSDWLSARG
ncbi:MAG TPA: AraC family transcriptional regulator [Paracoccaceae bacterium]|nr:AraC family transcriptional regulator [Paracoccaceae bacterium]